MTDTNLAAPPTATVTDIRRALIAEAADMDERRQTHRAKMHDDGTTARCDAYEGLARASAYGLLIAGILGQLEVHGGLQDLAVGMADIVAEVMANGGEVLNGANNDLDDRVGAT